MTRPSPPAQQAVDASRADGARVSRTIVNLWLDATLLGMFLVLATVSAIVQFVFPPGTTAAGWSLWGGSYAGWRQLQFAVICALAAGIALHVMLHWNWVCNVIVVRVLGRRAKVNAGLQTIYGVAFLIALLHVVAGVYLAALLTVKAPESASRPATVRSHESRVERPEHSRHRLSSLHSRLWTFRSSEERH